jgi:hypothetical protein
MFACLARYGLVDSALIIFPRSPLNFKNVSNALFWDRVLPPGKINPEICQGSTINGSMPRLFPKKRLNTLQITRTSSTP